MLGWVVARACASKSLKRVAVATSEDRSDDPIAAFCKVADIACHRGPLDDVAARFALAARMEDAPAFARITGDSPLIDAEIIDLTVALYHSGDCDLVTNVLARTFPIGQSVEVLRAETFQRVSRNLLEPTEREHITRHYYANLNAFRIVGFTSGIDAGRVQLSVDTPEDFKAAERVIELSGGKPGGWRSLAALRSSLAT